MKFKKLFLSIIFFNSILFFDQISCLANFKPPKKPSESQNRAGGTRGCPVHIGDLYIVGASIKDGFLIQETGLDTPALIYEVDSNQEETFLITITDSNDNLIYEKYLLIKPNQKTILIHLTQPIQVGIRYQVVAGLLCLEDVEAAKIINSQLIRVQSLTLLDKLTQQEQTHP